MLQSEEERFEEFGDNFWCHDSMPGGATAIEPIQQEENDDEEK